MAASALSGILFNRPGINNTLSKIRKPCMIAENLLLAPASTLADPLTITDVSGNPPNNPERIFPIPCAFNSRFAGVLLFNGSSLSTASIPNRVSILATNAIVSPTVHTSALFKYSHLGNIKKLLKDAKSVAIGRFTSWDMFRELRVPGTEKNTFIRMPDTTTTRGPGKFLKNFFFFNADRSQTRSITIDINPMINANGVILLTELISSENVLLLSIWKKVSSPE